MPSCCLRIRAPQVRQTIIWHTAKHKAYTMYAEKLQNNKVHTSTHNTEQTNNRAPAGCSTI